jgi:rubrerythrin
MTAASLSISPHEHYGPDLRDRILQHLQLPADEATYHLLTPFQMRRLIELRSPESPVVSLFLDLDGNRRIGSAWHSAFTSLRSSAIRACENRRTQQAIIAEFDKVQQALESELPLLGRGAAFFTCQAVGLWQKIAVPIPLSDEVHLGDRPHIRPLVRIQDEHDRFVVALLSEQLSRFFVGQIGQVEEVLRINGANPRAKIIHEHGPRDRYSDSALEGVRREARIFAHASELVFRQGEARYLVMSGTSELRADVMRELPKDVQQRVGGEISADFHMGVAAVAAAAEPAQRVIEEREELVTVQQVLDLGPSRSAWGVRPTLDALRDGRVATLVVDDGFTVPGALCNNCGALCEGTPTVCPSCEASSMTAEPDVVSVAIEQTLRERGALELVRSQAARQLMARIGPMAALLRW